MQQLTLGQSQAISGGISGSLTNLVQDTFGAFQNGLTPAELGTGLVGIAVGTGLATCPYKTAGYVLVGSYVVYSHFKPDFSGFTTWVGSFLTAAPSEVAA